jgi:hypothetical protein
LMASMSYSGTTSALELDVGGKPVPDRGPSGIVPDGPYEEGPPRDPLAGGLMKPDEGWRGWS